MTWWHFWDHLVLWRQQQRPWDTLLIPPNSLIAKLPFWMGCALTQQTFPASSTALGALQAVLDQHCLHLVWGCLQAPIRCWQKAVGFALCEVSVFLYCERFLQDKLVFLMVCSMISILRLCGCTPGGEGKANGSIWLSPLSVAPLQTAQGAWNTTLSAAACWSSVWKALLWSLPCRYCCLPEHFVCYNCRTVSC